MAPPLPPKPKIGPLVRRSLFAAAVGVAGCHKQDAMRIGPPPDPIRIGAEIVQPPPEELPPDAGAAATMPDAAFAASPPDASPQVAPAAADAGAVELPKHPPPVRIGPPVRDIDRRRKDPIRIGMRRPDPHSTHIRGAVVDPAGEPLAHCPVRVELPTGARIVTTDASGAFVLDGVAPGQHAAVVLARGFAPIEVRLTAARDARTVRLALSRA